MLRVDHAGEYGAVQIYKGQRAIFERLPGKARAAEIIAEMHDGEKAHLAAFDRLLQERRVRPTLLAPIWNAAGFALGAATALIGERAAMACTEAVEDVIEKHYRSQADELVSADPSLAATIAEFRDDELRHKETAEAEGAKDAAGYRALKAFIQTGCRVAIRLSEKI
jgi:ubiquinone biosynthesis monooxygenase Coq7